VAYRALYREWRPADFQSLVGQEHVSQTLRNALQKQRIAHAYLFAGSRGTGKTSTAKILAKAVNCLSPNGVEPCNQCINCVDVNEGRSLDVLEIDAASNRGIEEIRELKEKISFVPSQGKYKVYIIDEVHMLTTEAFNALLKTLEEPPAHVIFIMATTEPHKIPATILSRCQRFDFKKIRSRDMEKRLQEILDASGVTAEKGVLNLIVRKSEGGLRDAISLLDQCLSYCDQELSLQTAYDVLGMVKNDFLLTLMDAVIQKDAAQVLVLINNCLQDGIEPGQVLKDILEYLRNLLLLQACGSDSEFVSLDLRQKEQMLLQGRKLGLTWLSENLAKLAKVESDSRWLKNMRVVLETALLGMIYQTETPQRVDLARMAQAAMPTKAAKADPITKTANAATGSIAAQEKGAVEKPISTEEKGAVKESKAANKAIATEETKAKAEGHEIKTVKTEKEAKPAQEAKPAGETKPAQEAKETKEAKAAQEVQEVKDTKVKKTAPTTVPEKVAASAAPEKTTEEKTAGVTIDEVKEKWDLVMAEINKSKKLLYHFLTEATPAQLEENKLVLVFKSEYPFYKEKVEAEGNKKVVEQILEKIIGFPLRISCRLQKAAENQPPQSALPEDPVQKAINIFGAEYVSIKD